MTLRSRLTLAAVFAIFMLAAAGCSTAYYSAMETLGKEKRHLLRDKVEDVRESQTQAQDEFKDALTRMKELYSYKGGELEEFYRRLKSSYEDCESRAVQIENRISKAQGVAADMFKEWETEISQMNDAKLRDSSKTSLADARAKFKKLDTAMAASTKNMYPVLGKLKDYVLYLKHNLNAKAVGALNTEILSIEKEVDLLIKDMNTSITEADYFIKTF